MWWDIRYSRKYADRWPIRVFIAFFPVLHLFPVFSVLGLWQNRKTGFSKKPVFSGIPKNRPSLIAMASIAWIACPWPLYSKNSILYVMSVWQVETSTDLTPFISRPKSEAKFPGPYAVFRSVPVFRSSGGRLKSICKPCKGLKSTCKPRRGLELFALRVIVPVIHRVHWVQLSNFSWTKCFRSRDRRPYWSAKTIDVWIRIKLKSHRTFRDTNMAAISLFWDTKNLFKKIKNIFNK